MPRCVPCLDKQFKEALLGEVLDKSLREALEQLPVCGVRKRSAYQDFTSGCMKAKNLKGFDPGALKDCAAQWRQKKGMG